MLTEGGLRGFLVVRPAGNVRGCAISPSGSAPFFPLVRVPTLVSVSTPRSRKILRASSRRAVRSPLWTCSWTSLSSIDRDSSLSLATSVLSCSFSYWRWLRLIFIWLAGGPPVNKLSRSAQPVTKKRVITIQPARAGARRSTLAQPGRTRCPRAWRLEKDGPRYGKSDLRGSTASCDQGYRERSTRDIPLFSSIR